MRLSGAPRRAVEASVRPLARALGGALLLGVAGARAGEEPPPPVAAPAPPVAELRVRIEALTEPRSWSPALNATVYPAGADEPISVQLAPDPGRQGFFVGELDSPPARFLDAELQVDDTSAWRRVVPVPTPDTLVVSLLVERAPTRVTRVSWLPWAGPGISASSTVSLVVAFGWGVVCAIVVGWVVRGRAAR